MLTKVDFTADTITVTANILKIDCVLRVLFITLEGFE